VVSSLFVFSIYLNRQNISWKLCTCSTICRLCWSESFLVMVDVEVLRLN
jgi:hypothetical protein